MTLVFKAMPTHLANEFRNSKPDANGNPAERLISDGQGNPCRHCLCDIAEGKSMLLLAWRPFSSNQAYAETGPVFLCSEPCNRFDQPDILPPILATRPQFLIRAYDKNERIVEGTGRIAKSDNLKAEIDTILKDHKSALTVHIRSAINGCFQCSAEMVAK